MAEGKRRVYAAKEYIEHLRTGLADEIAFTGMVRADDEGDALHFAHTGYCDNWVALPNDLIASIEHIGSVHCKDHQHAIARITFKTPETDEGRFLLRLAAHQHHVAQRLMTAGGCPDGVCSDGHGGHYCC